MTWTNRAAVAAAAGALALATGAYAQQPASPQADAASEKRTFDPAFFARYNPVTAYDMVRQLPGFAINNGDNLRGFGATAGNVLIDGQRPSTKATTLSDELSRISAKDVARIELIGAAAAGDIDVRGYTELANVVLKPAAKITTSSTYLGVVQLQGDHLSERAGLVRAWKGKDFSSRLQTQVSESAERGDTAIKFYDGLGNLTGARDEFNTRYLGELLINGSLNWTPSPRDTLNLNGRIMGRAYDSLSGAVTRSLSGARTQVIADDYTEKDILYLDLGGDWERRLSPQSTVKLITVNSFVGWRPQEFFEQFPGAGPRDLATRINTDNKRGEHVLRGVWTIKPNAQHTIEAGLEGVFNYLDTQRSIANAVGAGAFIPQVLPVSSTRVEELRGEAFISDTWRMNPQWSLDVGFNFEASRITQTGDAQQEREFTYPKPRLIATWAPDKENILTLSLTRTVAQLNFSDFASVVQLVQGQLTVGNPDLKPQQVTAVDLQWKRSIGERGSILLKGFYNRIDDVQDFVVLQNGTALFTGAGNIGDGERYGARIEFAYPLDRFGVKGGMLKWYAVGSDSSVTDPITGVERPIASDFTFDSNIDFRQDLPEWKLAWGGDYTFPGGERYTFRLNEIQRRDFAHGDLDLFVETTAIDGLTVRLNLDNIGDSPNWLDRRLFSPSRQTSSTVSSREFRESTIGLITAVTVTGTF